MQRALRAGASPADARASDIDYARYCYHHLVVHDLMLKPSVICGRHSGVLSGRKVDEKERQEATFLPLPTILHDFCS